MYITCEQCSTIFRLDENLLKRTGSKVRCSQCRNVFVAKPPAAYEIEVDDSDIPADPPYQYPDNLGQELEGIDVAELDSILEEGRSAESVTEPVDQDGSDEIDVLADFDEADLDMDFDAALAEEESDLPTQDSAAEPEAQEMADPVDEISEKLDLNMDFELDDWDQELIQPPQASDEDDLDIAMDMDFDLEGGVEDISEGQASEANGFDDDDEPDEDAMLDENVELALDDFEDVLGGAEGKKEVEGDLPTVQHGDEELAQDLGPDESGLDEAVTEEMGAFDMGGLDDLLDDVAVDEAFEDSSEAGEVDELKPVTDDDDLDLSGLDTFLDDEDDSTGADLAKKEVELSLDGDFKPESEAALGESGLAAAVDGEIDDLDLADLDDLLDQDDDTPDAVSSDDDFPLDDDLELSLDEDLAVDSAAGESDIVLSGGGEDDDIDLADIGDLLDEDEDAPAVASTADDVSLGDELELGLDEDLTADSVAGEPDMALSADSEVDDLDLADIGDFLDEDDDTPAVAPSADDVSLDDELEFSLDDDLTVDSAAGESDSASSAEGQGDDLDLADLDDLLDGDDEAAVAYPEEDGLSLDEELDLSMEGEPDPEIEEKPQLDALADDRDEFDLSDFENLLGDDAMPSKSVAEATTEGKPDIGVVPESELSDGDDDFDISDLDNLLGDEEALEKIENDDLELSLDDGPDSDDDGDDFDLSGLDETLLVEDDTETPDDAADEMDLSLDDEMTLSLDDELDGAAAAVAEPEDDIGELEDLEFELDAEFEDKPVAQTDESSEAEMVVENDQQNEAMDLSDIEKMLEDDTIVPDKADAAESAGFGLEADDSAKWADETGDDLGLDDDEIDLSEIEEAIDAVDKGDQNDIFVDEGQELELDLDLEQEETAAADASEELEFELEMEDGDATMVEGSVDDTDSDSPDLSDFDLSAEEAEPGVETETIDGGDIQLEFQIEDSVGQTHDEETITAAKTTAAAASATTGFMEDEESFSGEETIATEPVREQPEVGMALPPQKTGMKKSLLIIPILLVLAALAYFGYDYTVKNNMRIPIVSDYLNPLPKDPSGVLQLATMEINSKFIENEAAGRLFVITGKVRNGYDIARKLIRLRGKLYTKGKTLVKTEHTFAGLVMADQELSTKSFADIKKHLNATKGQDTAITVGAGKSAPFMVVFSELPADLDEFVIELVSSIKAQ